MSKLGNVICNFGVAGAVGFLIYMKHLGLAADLFVFALLCEFDHVRYDLAAPPDEQMGQKED